MKTMATRLTLALVLLASCAASAQYGVIVNGPLGGLSPAASAPTGGVDTSSNQYYVCNAGVCKAHSIVLSSQGAQAALTTVTTAQTMFSYALPAGFMNVAGRALRICGSAMFSNAVTTPAITISVKIGSSVTPVSVATAANANSNTNSPLNFCFVIQTAAAGASGTDEAHGWVQNTVAAAWSSGTAVATYVDGNTAVSSTYDHAAANTITVKIAADAALTSVTPRQLVIEAIN